jgi:predicted Zn-dependent protease
MRSLSKFLFAAMTAVTLLAMPACDKENNKINLFTVQDDIDLGNQVAAEIASKPAEFPLLSRSLYPAAYAHLDRIMADILATGHVAYDSTFPWTAYIIQDDSMVNAFATPGGHIYFYTGLIKTLDNEAQFAGVVAHEMAHCARRHTTDQMTKYYGMSLLIAVALGKDPGMLAQIAADIAGGLTSLAFSRKMEYEADEYAVKYMSSTDHHPLALGDFFVKLEGLPRPPTFLSTHPSPEDRIEKINEAWVKYGSKVGDYFENRYQSFIAALP